ncbi:MAG: hypothetical protein ACP5VE_11700 [Chthonomonadales bacterium]
MGRWIFYAWDDTRDRQTRAWLRRAALSGSLPASLPNASRLALDQLPREAGFEEVCNAILLAECAVGDAVTCEGGLAECLLNLRRDDAWEALATTLADLISARPGIEAWFELDFGLVGVLTAAHVQAIAKSAQSLRARPLARRAPNWLRRLSPVQDPREGLADLLDLVAWCAENGFGLAAVAED